MADRRRLITKKDEDGFYARFEDRSQGMRRYRKERQRRKQREMRRYRKEHQRGKQRESLK